MFHFNFLPTFPAIIFQNGETCLVRHVGHGVLIREDQFLQVQTSFKNVWPCKYGAKALNSKDPGSLDHRRAMDLLVASVWPSGAETKFVSLEGFPPRPAFHTRRLDVCVDLLSGIWAEVTLEAFPSREVRDFLLSRVRCQVEI